MLPVSQNRYETLVSADGAVSAAGSYHHQQLGIEPPSIFAHEHPLINNKWVKTSTGCPQKTNSPAIDGWWMDANPYWIAIFQIQPTWISN